MGVQPELPFPGDADEVSPTFDVALRGLRDKAYLGTQMWQKKQWLAEREGCHPDLLRFEALFIRRMARLDVPMFCHEAVRSEQHQAELYALGVTKIQRVGPHTRGCAMDIVHAVKAWQLTKQQWALIGHVGVEVARSASLHIDWGGAWERFPDPAHWEVHDWRAVMGGFPFAKE